MLSVPTFKPSSVKVAQGAVDGHPLTTTSTSLAIVDSDSRPVLIIDPSPVFRNALKGNLKTYADVLKTPKPSQRPTDFYDDDDTDSIISDASSDTISCPGESKTTGQPRYVTPPIKVTKCSQIVARGRCFIGNLGSSICDSSTLFSEDSKNDLVQCSFCPDENPLVMRRLLVKHQRKVHHVCGICHRPFDTHHALVQHQGATNHREQTIHCVSNGESSQGISCNCRKRFNNLPAALEHMESGYCRSHISADSIVLWLIKHDPHRLIVSEEGAQKFLAEHRRLKEMKMASAHNAWELHRKAHRPVCKICSFVFHKIDDLRVHLENPILVHASESDTFEIFKCPMPKCEKRPGFLLLSQFGKHVESDENGCGAKQALKWPYSGAAHEICMEAQGEHRWIKPMDLQRMAFVEAYPKMVKKAKAAWK